MMRIVITGNTMTSNPDSNIPLFPDSVEKKSTSAYAQNALVDRSSGRHKSINPLFILLVSSSLLAGCGSKLPIIYNAGGKSYTFLNQDSSEVTFPEAYRGGLVVMSFIYTHCPDICPLTTNNMQHLQDTLKADGIHGIRFVSMTFDPHRDTPAVLKEYAEIRGIKSSDWNFLTGSVANTDSVLYSMKIRYFPGDSSYTKDGQLIYFIAHTDECVLLDRQARVRGVYRGSHLDFSRIVEDIKSLE